MKLTYESRTFSALATGEKVKSIRSNRKVSFSSKLAISILLCITTVVLFVTGYVFWAVGLTLILIGYYLIDYFVNKLHYPMDFTFEDTLPQEILEDVLVEGR